MRFITSISHYIQLIFSNDKKIVINAYSFIAIWLFFFPNKLCVRKGCLYLGCCGFRKLCYLRVIENFQRNFLKTGEFLNLISHMNLVAYFCKLIRGIGLPQIETIFENDISNYPRFWEDYLFISPSSQTLVHSVVTFAQTGFNIIPKCFKHLFSLSEDISLLFLDMILLTDA